MHQHLIRGVSWRPEDRYSARPTRRRRAYLERHRSRYWHPTDRMAEVWNQKTPWDRFREQMGGTPAAPDPGFLSGFSIRSRYEFIHGVYFGIKGYRGWLVAHPAFLLDVLQGRENHVHVSLAISGVQFPLVIIYKFNFLTIYTLTRVIS